MQTIRRLGNGMITSRHEIIKRMLANFKRSPEVCVDLKGEPLGYMENLVAKQDTTRRYAACAYTKQRECQRAFNLVASCVIGPLSDAEWLYVPSVILRSDPLWQRGYIGVKWK